MLRLPGIGVALVSEGPSAAAWVEGWFAALLHATQFALRSTPPATSVVASPAPSDQQVEEVLDGGAARVLEALEEECRRILTAAQDQASDIRESAARDAEALAARWPAGGREDETPPTDLDEEADRAARQAEMKRESDAMLKDAERAGAALLADAQREIDLLRRDMERTCATMLADTKRECDALTREAERSSAAMLADARRDADELRRDTESVRRTASLPPPYVAPREEWQRPDTRVAADTLLAEARRSAEDLLREARHTAEDIAREAARDRDRLFDELRRTHEHALREELQRAQWSRRDPEPPAPVQVVQAPAPAQVASQPVVPVASDESRVAALALLGAAAESVAAMTVLLGRAAAAGGPTPTAGPTGAPSAPAEEAEAEAAVAALKDLPGLFFGA